MWGVVPKGKPMKLKAEERSQKKIQKKHGSN